MPRVNILVETKIKRSRRVKQLEAMFDVPAEQKTTLSWKGDLPLEEKAWNVGLIVGPSGSGKSTVLKNIFGEPAEFEWSDGAVIDDIARAQGIESIANVCQAVGFNTIPAWMRPYRVLSNGERFRVELARRLLEAPEPILIDEFTSVVDRQVAKIGSHAVQKYVRHAGKRLVAASCHYDIIDWLQPDWIFEPGTMAFRWRSLRRRPELNVAISYVPFAAWKLFAPFHYLTASLARSARCYALFVDGRIASLAATMHRPHPRVRDVMGVSRLVTLPDWQGLGLAMVLVDHLARCYKALGKRLRTYPAHPALIRSFSRSPHWTMKRKGGDFSPIQGKTATIGDGVGGFGGRPCGVFEWTGPAGDLADAQRLIERNPRPTGAAR